jgi:hypothetical protein
VRRRKRRRAAAFVGGEGAPVGDDGGCGVLQHRRGKGVRKLQEIAGIDSSGRSSPGSGGRRRCSAGIRTKERLPVAGGAGTGAETVGREATLERGGGVGSVSRGVDERARSCFERIGRRHGREGKKREGGPTAEVPCGVGRPRPGCDAQGRRVAVRTAARWRRPGGPRWQRERGGGREWRVGRPEKKARGRA